MSNDDLFASLGDSFQLPEDDGNLSVGSFGDNTGNLDFSSELVFADDDPPQHDTTNTNFAQSSLKPQGGGNIQNNNNQGSMNSLPGANPGLSAALPAPPSMTMSSSSLNNSLSNMSSSFRGPKTATSSTALQNAAATLQGVPQFAFAQQQQPQQQQQQQQQQSNSNSFMQQQQHQQQLRSMQNFMNNPMNNVNNLSMNNLSMNNTSMNSTNMNDPMNNMGNPNMNSSMNRSSSMNNPMMGTNSNNGSLSNSSMGNASFNSSMPPPSRSSMTTPSLPNNNMIASSFNQQASNRFFGQQQQQQSNPLGSSWNSELEKPKRPLSAYEFFVQERKRLGALSDAQLQVIWKDQLDGRQKAIYLQQARSDRQRYITELKLWKARTERNQPVGAVGNFLKARLQGSKTDLAVEANKRGRLQPAIVSCPNLNASPGIRLQAMQQQQQQQMQFHGGGGQQNATFDNFQQPLQRQSQGGRPRSRFVANQMQRLQQGQGLADLASELGDDCTTAFVSAMIPRSQSASVVQHSSSLRYKQQSSPNMQQDPLLDPLMEFPGF